MFPRPRHHAPSLRHRRTSAGALLATLLVTALLPLPAHAEEPPVPSSVDTPISGAATTDQISAQEDAQDDSGEPVAPTSALNEHTPLADIDTTPAPTHGTRSTRSLASAPEEGIHFADAMPAEQRLPRIVTTDATDGVQEIAARRLLHHRHVDAAHLAWDEAAHSFDILVIDGATPKKADTLAVRLGPDADPSGTEVSRIRVPGGKRFRFLGDAGSIVWNAPERLYNGHSPVWTGIGSGRDFPSILDPDTLTLELVEVRGPGWVSIWNGAEEDATEFLSSRNPGHTRYKTPVGGHGHFNWSFEKPGRYTLLWRGLGQTRDGRVVVGDEHAVEWLVGTDADLGLPEGSWHPAHTITTAAESFNIETNEEVEAGAYNEDGSLVREEEASPPFEGSYTCLAPGHFDLTANNSAIWDGKKGDMDASIHGLQDGADLTLGAYEAVVPVPDSASSPLSLTPSTRGLGVLGSAGTRVWTLPQRQRHHLPWVGFSTEGMDDSHMDVDRVRLYAKGFTGPGRMLTWITDSLTSMKVVIDSKDEYTKYVFEDPSHVHLAHSFNQPGLYEVGWQFSTRYDGDASWLPQAGATVEVYYAVGDERIRELCPGWLEKYDRHAEGPDDGAQSGTPGNPGEDAQSGTPGNPGEDAQPSEDESTSEGDTSSPDGLHPDLTPIPDPAAPLTTPKPVDVCRATPIRRPATPREVALLAAGLLPAHPGAGGRVNNASTTLTFNVGTGASGNAVSGHFDVGPAIDASGIGLRVKDDRRQPPTWRPGSALTFAIGDAGRLTAPEALSFLTAPGSPVWLIGATQHRDVPWVGFNSQHPGLRGRTTGSVTFTLESVSGPGRVAVFESGTFGTGVGRVLLSSAGSSFTLPPHTHAHHNWVFTAPGTYRLTLRASVQPTGAAIPSLTDVSAAGARVAALPQRDAAGRLLVEEIVGRTASGAECHIALPSERIGASSAGGFVAAANVASEPITPLDDTSEDGADDAQSAALARSDGTDAGGTRADGATKSGLEARGAQAVADTVAANPLLMVLIALTLFTVGAAVGVLATRGRGRSSAANAQ